MSLGSASGAMSLREPITPESLCVALNRATSLRLAPRAVVLAYHHGGTPVALALIAPIDHETEDKAPSRSGEQSLARMLAPAWCVSTSGRWPGAGTHLPASG